MKIKPFIINFSAVFLLGCVSPAYLPSYDQIDVNQYGSFIKVEMRNGDTVTGELIAVERNKLVVLNSVKDSLTTKPVILPINEIGKFKLQYARPKKYGWSVPVFGLATISHGAFLILSLPVNLIVTASVTATGENAFTFSDKTMTYDQLPMYARFPQGVPPGIDLTLLK